VGGPVRSEFAAKKSNRTATLLESPERSEAIAVAHSGALPPFSLYFRSRARVADPTLGTPLLIPHPELAPMPSPLSNRRRKAIASLARRRHRRRHDQTIIEGRRALDAALDGDAPLVDCVITHEALDDPEIQSLLDRLTVPVYVTDADTMADLTDVTTPQGLVAVVERRLVDPDAFPDRLGPDATLLLLDGVQDPGNVGTLLRTAAWFGAEAVAAGPGTAGLYGPKVMRAATGGHWSLSLTRPDAPGPFLDRLRRAGWTLYGADLQGVRADAWTPERPSVLALGSEAHGLSPAVLDRLNTPVAIPGAPRRPAAESLNVAVAGGILVYEWMGTQL
jgi:TrmH family RNA methyltransferase